MNEERFDLLCDLEGQLIRSLSAISFFKIRVLKRDAYTLGANYARAYEAVQAVLAQRDKRLSRFSNEQLRLRRIRLNRNPVMPIGDLQNELREIEFEVSFRRLLHLD